MKKLWNSEPVVLVFVLLVVAMLVQKVWLGEAIDTDWVEWVLGLFGLATGATLVRSKVSPVDRNTNDDYDL